MYECEKYKIFLKNKENGCGFVEVIVHVWAKLVLPARAALGMPMGLSANFLNL